MYDEPLPFLSGLVQRCQRCGGGGPPGGPCVRFSGPFQAGGISYTWVVACSGVRDDPTGSGGCFPRRLLG